MKLALGPKVPHGFRPKMNIVICPTLDGLARIWRQGSTFTVTLPAEAPRLPDNETSKAAPADPSNLLPSASTTVLVVDDDPAVLDLMSRVLAKEGWRVATANNGPAGLDLARKLQPDVITLDVMMPEMDGFEFVREFRRQPEGQAVPIIVITAKDLTEDDRRRLNGYVTQVLEKGAYRLDQLLHEIRRLVMAHAPHRRKER